MITEATYKDRLKMSSNEIVHLVSAFNIDRGNRIAYCGFDTSGRTFKPRHTANCVVCIEMAEKNEREREEWNRERDEWLDSLH